MKYLYIRYPDNVLLVKKYDGKESQLRADEASGFFNFIGCMTAWTSKRTYDKAKDALQGKCEQCRLHRAEWKTSDSDVNLCQKCAKDLAAGSDPKRKELQ
jgi:hypothetical protein